MCRPGFENQIRIRQYFENRIRIRRIRNLGLQMLQKDASREPVLNLTYQSECGSQHSWRIRFEKKLGSGSSLQKRTLIRFRFAKNTGSGYSEASTRIQIISGLLNRIWIRNLFKNVYIIHLFQMFRFRSIFFLKHGSSSECLERRPGSGLDLDSHILLEISNKNYRPPFLPNIH